MYREEIEQGFVNAGWHIDADFLGLLVIGYKGDGLSILTREQALDANVAPLFELIDHKRNVTFGVQVIPTPQQATKLLQEYGQPQRRRRRLRSGLETACYLPTTHARGVGLEETVHNLLVALTLLRPAC